MCEWELMLDILSVCEWELMSACEWELLLGILLGCEWELMLEEMSHRRHCNSHCSTRRRRRLPQQ